MRMAQIIDTAARSKGYTGTFIACRKLRRGSGLPAGGSSTATACHVNGSWKQDLGTLGAMTVAVPGSVTDLTKSTSATATLFESSGACVGATGSVAAKTLKCTSVDLNKMPVISPKAASLHGLPRVGQDHDEQRPLRT
jgi:hypothetical protein